MNKLALLLSVVSVSVYAELQEVPGTLVPPFGGMGTGFNAVTLGSGSSAERINSIALDSQGRIVVGGIGGSSDAVIARFTADGILDTTFGGMGTGFNVILMNETNGQIESVIIDSQGRIVGAGRDGLDPISLASVAVVRLTPEGVLDTSFGPSGTGFSTVLLSGILGPNTFFSITLDVQDRIIGVGEGGSANLGFVMRFTEDGILDTTFGGTGTGSNIVSSISELKSVVVDDQGRINAVGNSVGSSDPLIVRFTPDGLVDTSFGGNGTGINVIDVGTAGRFEEVKFDKEGRLVAVGSTGTNGSIIARFNIDGTLDTTFGGSGLGYNVILIPGSFGGNDVLHSFAFDLQGRIVAGGQGGGDTLIMRFTYDGVLDPSFGGDGTGVNSLSVGSGGSQIFSLAIDTQGNVVGGGGGTVGSANAAVMQIYNQSLTNLASSIRQKYLFSCS